MISAKDWALLIAKAVDPAISGEALRRLAFIVEDIRAEQLHHIFWGHEGSLSKLPKSLSEGNQ